MECKYFKQGKCLKGNDCSFKHIKVVEEATCSLSNCRQLQSIEIQQLQQLYNATPLESSVLIRAKITDPDFPFDMEFVECKFELPAEYPLTKACKFTLTDEKVPAKYKP